MKLLTFNVNNDYRETEHKAKIIFNLIIERDIDIAGLQEVTPDILNHLTNQCGNCNCKSYCLLVPPVTSGFFNVMVVKTTIANHESFCVSFHTFLKTNMSRGFTMIRLNNTDTKSVFVTTHLESGANNIDLRQSQCKEILETVGEATNGFVFGDFNFCNENETFPGLESIPLPENRDIFSYDSKLNPEAIYPFRTNLDRFYSIGHVPSKFYSTILSDITVSDHFPVYFEY